MLAKDTFIAAVAVDGERVVGAIAAYVLEKYDPRATLRGALAIVGR